VALAGLAASALHVEREPAGRVAARLCLRQAREPVADRREGARVCRGIRPRRAADRRLVDVDDLVEMLGALDGVVLAGMFARPHELPGERLVERLDHERRLAAAGHAGDAGEGAQRNLEGYVPQIVRARADQPKLLAEAAGATLQG